MPEIWHSNPPGIACIRPGEEEDGMKATPAEAEARGFSDGQARANGARPAHEECLNDRVLRRYYIRGYHRGLPAAQPANWVGQTVGGNRQYGVVLSRKRPERW